jgi:hypothetical protein
MKKILIITNLLFAGASLSAQDYTSDAGRLMRTDLSGTARSLGAGGAFSSVGADMSGMSSNPAGIALYRSHEFAISGGGIGGSTNSTYLGQSSGTQNTSFGIGELTQAGFIFATRRLSNYDDLRYNRGGSKLDRFVIGFGYQKLADYTSVTNFSGLNTQNSYAGAIANQLNANQNSINTNNFPIPIVNGYNAGLNNYPSSTSDFLTSTIGLPVSQSGQINTTGSLNEFNLTLGFNVGNTVYIGAGMGLPYVSYHRNETITEFNSAGDSSYQSQYNYSLSGWGINGKLGIIVKPVQWVRLGAAIQTPTMYSLTQSEWGGTNSIFGGDTIAYGASSAANYQFVYNNPMKGTFGASFYLTHWGFLSVDYELNDYAHSRYFFNGNDPQSSNAINSSISATYKLSSTVKVGAEFAYKGLRLRAGFAWSGSPYANNLAPSGHTGTRLNYTGGIGYRGRVFFADLAYVRTMYKDYLNPYADVNGVGPAILNTFTANTVVATIGFRFGLRRD